MQPAVWGRVSAHADYRGTRSSRADATQPCQVHSSGLIRKIRAGRVSVFWIAYDERLGRTRALTHRRCNLLHGAGSRHMRTTQGHAAAEPMPLSCMHEMLSARLLCHAASQSSDGVASAYGSLSGSAGRHVALVSRRADMPLMLTYKTYGPGLQKPLEYDASDSLSHFAKVLVRSLPP